MRRHEAIEDQALDWLVRRSGPDWTETEQADFDAWLDQSMAHKAAFWRADHGWRQADRIGSLGFRHRERSDVSWLQRKWRPAAIAASLAALAMVGGLSIAPSFVDRTGIHAGEERFMTQVGGRRFVPLPDGSEVELNTQTVIRTAVGKVRRQVWLDSGEAFFAVAHRNGEPFVVHAGQQRITVLGTKFSVRRDKNRVTVNVLQGRVRVESDEGARANATVIAAGDTAISRDSSILVAPRSQLRVENALAWREGRLSFDQAPLSDVAAEFNRYNRTRLIVADAAAGRIPIGGSFDASSVDSFARLLHDAYGLKVERNKATVKVSTP
jgi:transmembrane sensor